MEIGKEREERREAEGARMGVAREQKYGHRKRGFEKEQNCLTPYQTFTRRNVTESEKAVVIMSPWVGLIVS